MTLQGKIIKISYLGYWELVIHTSKKKFETWDELFQYLVFVRDNAKDLEKKILLEHDLRNMCRGHNDTPLEPRRGSQ